MSVIRTYFAPFIVYKNIGYKNMSEITKLVVYE